MPGCQPYRSAKRKKKITDEANEYGEGERKDREVEQTFLGRK